MKKSFDAPLFYTSMQLKPLWPGFQYKLHQETGIHWMLRREKEKVAGGLLCDEMGLGKTIQMMGLLRNGVKKPGEKNLLIAPVAVLEQWKKIAIQSGISVMIPSPTGMSWISEGPVKSKLAPQLHCIGYEAAKRKRWLVAPPWTRLIYDEAHRLASQNSSTDLAKRITAEKKWMLSGTPIVNKLTDLITLLELVGVEHVPRSMEMLEPILKTYILARTMEQLRSHIPDAPKAPTYVKQQLDFLTKKEETFYHDKTDIIAKRLQALGTNNTLERLKLIMRLRQVSLHPQIYNEARKNQLQGLWDMPDWTETSTKFEAIRTLITTHTESHKWILFCHFKHEMTMLEEMLRAESKVELVQQYHGSLTAEQKEEVLEKSHMPVMEGKQEVLLVQLQAGGTGLNLQHFDRIIFTGPWWTQALMEQAVGRAVRIGQTKQVVVYHLHLKAEDTDDRINIDRIMMDKAESKGVLCRKVLESATSALKLEELTPSI
ncbi:DEAD/DEAH box helicase [bacterium]|nr:DEAD/DEAH box helicase [bacterium]